MKKSIRDVVNRIYQEILEYESDTFSAEGSGITKHEAEEVTALLIKDHVSIGDNVDGVSLSYFLSEIRGEYD